MHKITICLALFLITKSGELLAQDEFWLRIHNSKDEYGYADTKGKIKIPFGKYSICSTDTFRNMAIVLHRKLGWIALDKKQRVLFSVFPFDNGPDYVSSGLFRIVKGELIGFANMEGTIVIEPRFRTVRPFTENLAAFCEGCIKIRSEEHVLWAGGKWGFVDKLGNVCIQPTYEDVLASFNDGIAKVKLNKIEIWIDEQGKALGDQAKPSKDMDNFEISPENAHPNAKKLLTDAFFWSPIEETGPFGNDDGWDSSHGFFAWRKLNKTESPVIYLNGLIKEWGYPTFDFNVIEPEKVKQLLADMNSRLVTGQDNAIVAVGFGQFIIEGNIDDDIRELTRRAIARELTTELLNQFPADYRGTRKEQLEKMLSVLDQM